MHIILHFIHFIIKLANTTLFHIPRLRLKHRILRFPLLKFNIATFILLTNNIIKRNLRSFLLIIFLCPTSKLYNILNCPLWKFVLFRNGFVKCSLYKPPSNRQFQLVRILILVLRGFIFNWVLMNYIRIRAS